MQNNRVFALTFAKVYPLYVHKAERTNRSQKAMEKILRQ